VAELEVAVALEAVQEGVAAVANVVGEDDALAGKRVLLGAREPCGECEVCRRGGASACPTARVHALTAQVGTLRVARRWLVELGDGLELPGPAAAAAAGDLALAYTLYARANLAPTDPVVVIGATPVARFLVEVVIAKGIAPVVTLAAAAPATWRAWLAAKAVAVADLDAAHIADAFAVRDGAGMMKRASRPWRMIVADESLDAALAIAPPRAQLIAHVHADGHARTHAHAHAALTREVSIAGVVAPHPDLVLEAAALAARGEVDLDGGVVTLPAATPPPQHADSTRTLVRLISAREA
jgi:D-arabinose 1-dehydrogenase-like Zn-dependent alcohol dehydrogenase